MNKKGITLAEILMAALLLSLIFLAVSSLYIASQKFFIKSTQNIIVGYEVQYAIQHIYKNAMMGIGDINSPAIPDPAGGDTLTIRINENNPLTAANYNTNVMTYSYYKSDDKLMFDKGTPMDPSDDESLIPKVTVTAVNFTKSGNALTGYIEAYYNDVNQKLKFYFSCYPRLSSFN